MCQMGTMNDHGVVPAMVYATAPPSPPFIHLPTFGQAMSFTNQMRIMPSFESVGSCDLTNEDMLIITQGQAQIAEDRTTDWRYDMRRSAQPILDFLWLGPVGVLRDTQFLAKEGFTLLLAVRDARLAGSNLMDARKAAASLGIASASIDVSGSQELIHAMPNAIRIINNHLLDLYRSQVLASSATSPSPLPSPGALLDSRYDSLVSTSAGAAASPPPSLAIQPAPFRRGKVLVFCESGNGRSAILVAAYLMTMYGLDYVKAAQFINMERFCTSFDDEAKHLLHTYHDILVAKRQVDRAAQGASVASAFSPSSAVFTPTTSKRRCDEMSTGEAGPDQDRQDRQDHDVARQRGVAPFADTPRQKPNADVAMQD